MPLNGLPKNNFARYLVSQNIHASDEEAYALINDYGVSGSPEIMDLNTFQSFHKMVEQNEFKTLADEHFGADTKIEDQDVLVALKLKLETLAPNREFDKIFCEFDDQTKA